MKMHPRMREDIKVREERLRERERAREREGEGEGERERKRERERDYEICNTFLQKRYGAAIHLVRNPFNALVAEYNREMSNRSSSGGKHTNTVGKERFGKTAK